MPFKFFISFLFDYHFIGIGVDGIVCVSLYVQQEEEVEEEEEEVEEEARKKKWTYLYKVCVFFNKM